MDELQYRQVQETIINEAALRQERAANLRKARTYRRRALILTGRLSEEREYRRCAEHLAEAMMAHAGRVEEENVTLCRRIAELESIRGEWAPSSPIPH